MSCLARLRPAGRVNVVLTVVAAIAAPAVVAAQAVVRPQQAAGPAAASVQQAAGQRPGGQETRDPDERAAGIDRVPDENEPSADGTATLLLTPSHLQVRRGQRVRLTLSVLGADDLRRLPATLRFAPEVLELTAVRLGRVWDEGPEPVLLHDASRPGEVTIGLGLLDKNAAGVTGSAELLELEFIAVGVGDAALRIERFAAIGPGSRPQPTTALSAEIVVQ